jgi:hypothetical protein
MFFLRYSVNPRQLGGVKRIVVGLLQSSEGGTVASELNAAWERFWADPAGFPTWERASVERLFRSSLTDRASQ